MYHLKNKILIQNFVEDISITLTYVQHLMHVEIVIAKCWYHKSQILEWYNKKLINLASTKYQYL